MDLPEDFFDIASSHQQYVVYGDSVTEHMTTLVIINGIKYIMTFDQLWNWLEPQVKKTNLEEKEYLYLENFDLQIITYNSKLDKLEFKNPKFLMRHKINARICRLTITNDQWLDVTNDHSLLHYNGEEMIEIKPKEAQYLPVIRQQFELDNFNIDPIYYILGLWFADGSFPKADYYPGLSSQYYNELTDYLIELDPTFKPYLRNTGKKGDFQFNYKPVREILLENELKGVKSPDRTLSNRLFEYLKNDMSKFISFISGYYTGDGSCSSGIITFNSANKVLLNQLKDLFLYYGMYSHILIDKNGRHYKGKINGDMYKLKFIGVPNSMFIFLEQFSRFKDSNIQKTSLNYGRNFNSVGHENKGIVRGFENCDLYNIKPVKVNNKEQILYTGYVYDFTEPTNKNFLANGFLVHNTDSLYINVPSVIVDRNNVPEAVAKADEISEEINAALAHYLNSYLLPKMGINPEYNKTDFKTELVCDGLLLLNVKKNYAFSLLAKEGKLLEPPKVKYTNLTVVKSDTAQFTKDFLTRMVEDIILNPEMRDRNLLTEVNELAKEMKGRIDKCIENWDFTYIGSPKKWGTGYKNDPWQVTAFKLANTIVDHPILTPMSAGIIVPVTILNPIEFERKISTVRNKHKLYIGNTPISKLTKIGLPYNYNKEQLMKAFDYYNLRIDSNECWSILFNKTSQRVVDVVKHHQRFGG